MAKRERNPQRDKIKRILKFFKFNKPKIIIFIVIILISLGFQWIFEPGKCLSIICSPYILGVLYYVFWPFDLLAILILGNIPPNPIILFIAKIVALLLQIIYWYILSCLIAIPINKIRGVRGKSKNKKKKEHNKRIKAGIEKALIKAKQIEEQKNIEKMKKRNN